MLIGSLVELHVGLHLCLCFSYLEKLFFKKNCLDTSSIPCCLSSFFSFFLSQSRQLFDTWECFCILDSVSTPGGSIENISASSTASRHLVDRSSFCSCSWWFVPRHLLDTYICQRPYFSIPSSIDVLTPLDTFICRDLLMHYLNSLCDLNFILFDLSLDTSLFSLPNYLISLQSLFLKVSSSFFKIFFTW